MDFIGKYTSVRNENLYSYLKGVGVPYMVRMLILSTNASLDILKDGDYWAINLVTFIKLSSNKFKLGEVYEESYPGAKFKSVTTLEESKLITRLTSDIGRKSMKIFYELMGDQLILTLSDETNGLEAKRFFKKLI